MLDAKVAEYIIVARKKDNEWFIGSITNSKTREISISFNFLTEGDYVAYIYTDAGDAGIKPDHLIRQSRIVKNTDTIPLQLAAGGGTVHIKGK